MIIGSKPWLDAISETPKMYGDYQLKRTKQKNSWPYN